MSALLGIPVYYESEHRTVASSLMDKPERVSDYEWMLNISNIRYKKENSRVTAHDICRQVLKVRNANGGGALSLTGHFKSVKPVSDKSVLLTTRLKIAEPERLLCNSAFSIPINLSGVNLSSKNKPVHLNFPDGKEISIYAHDLPSTDNTVQNFFDLSGPMTTAPEKWMGAQEQINIHKFPMDILYALELPSGIDIDDKNRLIQGISRAKIAAALHNMIEPQWHLTDLWKPQQKDNALPSENVGSSGSEPSYRENGANARICYSSYTGNREMATALSLEICRILGFEPELFNVPYTELRSEKHDGNFKVILISCPWPHPASFLTSFYHSSGIGEEFKSAYANSLACSELQISYQYAAEAEKLLRLDDQGIIILGQVIGCMRSSRPIVWWPPSGWIYLHNLEPFWEAINEN